MQYKYLTYLCKNYILKSIFEHCGTVTQNNNINTNASNTYNIIHLI